MPTERPRWSSRYLPTAFQFKTRHKRAHLRMFQRHGPKRSPHASYQSRRTPSTRMSRLWRRSTHAEEFPVEVSVRVRSHPPAAKRKRVRSIYWTGCQGIDWDDRESDHCTVLVEAWGIGSTCYFLFSLEHRFWSEITPAIYRMQIDAGESLWLIEAVWEVRIRQQTVNWYGHTTAKRTFPYACTLNWAAFGNEWLPGSEVDD